ncbi:hypothetical protein D3C87_1288180 [compost metagenome]|jgi:hypothetical protein|uniref:hypothetical protein n=1 Tax=Agrobacterium tumefaciens complex TaxID=1183400 RepID=UPI000FA06DFF|nr:hypothetical protein [Agrobacterium tumefaciens]MBP2540392.1 hypothetical protein [Agrobacterium tumefaciens]WQE42004.1 hypothetical protein U0027_17390 [Agrobacterium tumefaciens]
MASILEITVAEETASSIDSSGQCSHKCLAHTPLGLAQPEADDLHRYDPEAYQKLSAYGVTVHDLEIEDLEQIGQLYHIPVINVFDKRTSKKLYKHAIALRLQRDLLIADSAPDKHTLEKVCVAFGNNYHVL